MVINIFLHFFDNKVSSLSAILKYFVFVLAFVFSLLKPIIRIFTICKNIFILNWTKSECPNFRLQEKWKFSFAGKRRLGLKR